MAVKTLNELFEHELKDIYYAEHRLFEALQQLAEQSKHREVKRAFTSHRKETQGQIKRLQKVFKMLGETPEVEKCPGIEGLLKEQQNFTKKEKPSQEILDYFNLGAAAKTERYEITAYEGLIEIAQQIGMEDAVELLSQNLQEEENALVILKSLAEEYDTDSLMDEEEEEEETQASAGRSGAKGGSAKGGAAKGGAAKGGASKSGASKSSGSKSSASKSSASKSGGSKGGSAKGSATGGNNGGGSRGAAASKSSGKAAAKNTASKGAAPRGGSRSGAAAGGSRGAGATAGGSRGGSRAGSAAAGGERGGGTRGANDGADTGNEGSPAGIERPTGTIALEPNSGGGNNPFGTQGMEGHLLPEESMVQTDPATQV